eukprot:166027-Prymnesium_polylepis.5
MSDAVDGHSAASEGTQRLCGKNVTFLLSTAMLNVQRCGRALCEHALRTALRGLQSHGGA